MCCGLGLGCWPELEGPGLEGPGTPLQGKKGEARWFMGVLI